MKSNCLECDRNNGVNRINGVHAKCSGNIYFHERDTNTGRRFSKKVNIEENNRIFVYFFDDYQSTKSRLSSYLLTFFSNFLFWFVTFSWRYIFPEKLAWPDLFFNEIRLFELVFRLVTNVHQTEKYSKFFLLKYS